MYMSLYFDNLPEEIQKLIPYLQEIYGIEVKSEEDGRKFVYFCNEEQYMKVFKHVEDRLPYYDGFKETWKVIPISDYSSKWCHITFKDLKAFIEKNKDLPDNTPILYENISEKLLDESWSITPMLWEKSMYGKEWSPGIRAWQVYVSEDKNGDKAVFFTAHY